MNIEIVLYYFSRVYSGFLVQLILAEILFVYKLKRKPLFFVRLAAGLLCLAALTFVTSCVQFFLP